MPSELLFSLDLETHSSYSYPILTISALYRRLIGRRFDDPTVKKDIESWPFKVNDEGGQPKIEVEYLGEKKTFNAQEISSMVLIKVMPIHLRPL